MAEDDRAVRRASVRFRYRRPELKSFKWERKERFELRTTHVWDKIGLTEEVQTENSKLFKWIQKNSAGKNNGFVVGVIDGGFWEDAPFFGHNQILGETRAFRDQAEVKPTRTNAEHGTSSASLVGCRFGLIDEDITALKTGTIRGGLPSCNLRLYQVLDNSAIGIETAVHAALEDGVAILNMSIGTPVDLNIKPFHHPIAASTFAAMAANVLPCLPAGNEGCRGMVENSCVWELTAAACNSEKKFETKLELLQIDDFILGQSVNEEALSAKCGLLHVNDVLGPRKADATGKVIVCEADDYDLIPDLSEAPFIGSAGLVVIRATEYAPLDHWLPAVVVNEIEGQKVLAYMNDYGSKAEVMIMASVLVDNPDFPKLAYCSSRLPNPLTDCIHKPDISGEGELVICATVQTTEDGRHVLAYSYLTGTSIATPVVCSVVALVRLHHPDWSASAIKSAVMTTATDMKWRNALENLGMGSGLANATRAVDPGLVYDMDIHDYCKFVRSFENCSEILLDMISEIDDGEDKTDALDLNYPSFKVTFRGKEARKCKFNRKLKYVGTSGPVTFKADKRGSDYTNGFLKVTVEPETLHFANYGDEIPYSLTVEVSSELSNVADDHLLYMQLVWTSQGDLSQHYEVKSPVRVVLKD